MNNNVIKAGGNRENFSEEKLINSLKNAGASDDLIFSIIKKIKKRKCSLKEKKAKRITARCAKRPEESQKSKSQFSKKNAKR